jgi:hypothetical protein
MNPGVAVIVPTKHRERLLVERSLRSLADQNHTPERVIVVTDGAPLSPTCHRELCALLRGTTWSVVENARTPGAAGAWNTALDRLSNEGFRGFVALLDDDDSWDREHIQVNFDVASASSANIAVSGLRLSIRGEPQARPFIEKLDHRDFLVGNPGWQGSNTFVSLPLLMAVGGFDETLASLHDRDLALRLLQCPAARPILIRQWTATWHFGTPGSLSLPGAPRKLEGLRRFWQIHGGFMSAEEQASFFSRAERLFGFPRAVIVVGPSAVMGEGG